MQKRADFWQVHDNPKGTTNADKGGREAAFIQWHV